MGDDICRVLRVLEYIGPRSWIEKTFSTNAVPANGSHHIQDEPFTRINSAVITPFPEYVPVHNTDKPKNKT